MKKAIFSSVLFLVCILTLASFAPIGADDSDVLVVTDRGNVGIGRPILSEKIEPYGGIQINEYYGIEFFGNDSYNSDVNRDQANAIQKSSHENKIRRTIVQIRTTTVQQLNHYNSIFR
ncbi:MAG: hypothetical protein GY874_22145 [Desulfobacteraceae bacterium]|nr:hypothetical protein [Desulfobacteraceae bacterium]